MESYQNSDLREAWIEFNSCFSKLFYEIINNNDLTLQSSWELEYKAIGEIGGRLIEDFLIGELEKKNENQNKIFFEPVHARSLGDLKCSFNFRNNKFIFYIDVKTNYIFSRERTHEFYLKKGIKKGKPGQSHPNIMSVEKLKTFVKDKEHINSDIIMLFIKYDIDKDINSFRFRIDSGLNVKSFFLLRDISEDYFDVGNLGKGQIQMSKLNDLKFIERTKNDFLNIVLEKRDKKRVSRPTKI